MEKLKMHSPDQTAKNVERIRELFPSCVTETRDDEGNVKYAIDMDQLKQELSGIVIDGADERYQLNWPGKRESIITANSPISKTLRPSRQQSVNFDTTRNIFIQGDNLEALKLTRDTYLGKVKLIYIDPPYNTGNDFIYEDDFSEAGATFLARAGDIDGHGNKLVANTDANGRFHSDWLSMMYSRLKVSRSFLKDDGFIVVSIDDAESANLKRMLDEIFGESNHIAVLCWDKNRKNDARFFSVGHEYMYVYAKDKQLLTEKNVILREPKEGIEAGRKLFDELRKKLGDNWSEIQERWRSHYRSMSDDNPEKQLGRYSKIGPRGPFRDDGNISWPGGGGPKYEIIHPVTGKPCKIPDGGWRYSKPERFWEDFDAGKVVFGPDETTLPRQCRYLFESDGQVMPSVFYSYAQTSAVEFQELMGGRVFDNPKNWRDLQRIIRYLTSSDDIVLDFFAGSASTAHAVLAQNASDGGSRRFILVQIAQAIDEKSEAWKAGYRTIPDVGVSRIRKAAQNILSEPSNPQWNKDVGFRFLTVDSSNMSEVFYSPSDTRQADLLSVVENVRPERGNAEDLLFQVLIDWGIDISLPINRAIIDGKTVFSVNNEPFDLVACFDKEITEDFVKKLAAQAPLRVVFRDSGFASDAVKINVDQIFAQLSPSTEVKSI